MKIGVLTYDGVPHRKTYDVLCRLKAEGQEEVEVFGVPFHYRKTYQPLIPHRPEPVTNMSAEELCHNLGYKYFSGGGIPTL